MLTSVLGVLLAASFGSGPHDLRPDDTCLMRTRCGRSAVYCLLEHVRCEPPAAGDLCLVTGCGDPPLLEP